MDDRRQFQHVAVLLGRTAWRHVGGGPPNDRGEQSAAPPPLNRLAGGGYAEINTPPPSSGFGKAFFGIADIWPLNKVSRCIHENRF